MNTPWSYVLNIIMIEQLLVNQMNKDISFSLLMEFLLANQCWLAVSFLS